MNVLSILKKLQVCFLLVVTLTLSAYFLTSNLQNSPDPADYLPGDTVALIQWKSLAATFSSFRSSPIGKQIFSPDFPGNLQKMSLPADRVDLVRTLLKDIDKVSKHPLFSVICSKRTSLALLPAEYDSLSIEEYVQKNSVLISGLNLPLRRNDVVHSLIGKTFRYESYTYQGKMVTRFYLQPGLSLYSTVIDKTFFCGFDPRPVERCVAYYNNRLIRPDEDLLHGGNFSLYADGYKTKKDFAFYVDFESLYGLYQKLATSPSPWISSDAIPTSLYMRQYREGSLNRFTLNLQQPETEKGLLVHRILHQETATSGNLGRIQEDASIYFWSNWFDLNRLWSSLSIAPSLETATVMFLIGQKVYEYTQLDVETFTAMFGSEVGFYVQDEPSVADIRIPMICFQFQLRQPDYVRTFLDMMLKDVATRTVDINGISAVAVMMADGLIQPAYAIMEDQLVIADSIEMLRQFIVVPGRSLNRSAAFSRVKGNLVSPSNLAAYGKIAKINLGLQAIISWSLDSLQRNGYISEEGKRTLLTTLILPLFQSMKDIESQSLSIKNSGTDFTLNTVLYSP